MSEVVNELAVALHFGPEMKETSLPGYVEKYATLFDALEAEGRDVIRGDGSERSIIPIITIGKEAYDLSRSAPVTTEYYTVARREEDGLRVATCVSGRLAVGAALDTSGGFARHVDTSGTRALNPKGIRGFCLDKINVHNTLEKITPPNEGAPSLNFALEGAEDRDGLSAWLEKISGDEVVIREYRKPAQRWRKHTVPCDVLSVQNVIGDDPEARFLIQRQLEGTYSRLRTHMVDEEVALHIGLSPSGEYIPLGQKSVSGDVVKRVQAAVRTMRQTEAERLDRAAESINSYVAVDSVIGEDGVHLLTGMVGSWPEFVPKEPGRDANRELLGQGIARKLIAMAVA